jgi:hypothetical protein
MNPCQASFLGVDILMNPERIPPMVKDYYWDKQAGHTPAAFLIQILSLTETNMKVIKHNLLTVFFL